MLNVPPIELLFVLVIIVIQVVIFGYTLQKGRSLGKSIPTDKDSFRVELISKIVDDEEFVPTDKDNVAQIRLIGSKPKPLFQDILDEINNYLVKNSGFITDINHLKEINKRIISKEESGIKALIPIPLYLGLLGTILGVVIGLFNIPSLTVESNSGVVDAMQNMHDQSEQLGVSVGELVEGVKYAMLASFAGLLFTTIGAGYVLRKLRLRIDEGSNLLIAFIQSELFPTLSKDLIANFNDLNVNLSSFTKSFLSGVEKLQETVDKNYVSVKDQLTILEEVQQMDIVKVAQINNETFRKLKGSIASLDLFNKSVGNIAQVIGATNDIGARFELIANRTQNFEKIASNISSDLRLNTKLIEFLNSHFSELEQRRKDIQTTVKIVDDSLTSAMVTIEDNFKTSQTRFADQAEQHMQFLSEVTLAEEDFLREEKRHLQEALDNNRNRLGKLDYLENINVQLVEQLKESQNANKKMLGFLETMEAKLSQSSSHIQELKKASIVYQVKVFFWNLYYRLTRKK